MPERPADPASEPRAGNEFYVGYLPVGPVHAGWMRWAAGGVLWLLVAVAAVVAATMRDAGPARWNASERVALVGTLEVRPYPVLRGAVLEPAVPGDGPRSYLLVEAGKLGGRAGLAPLDGRRVRVMGSRLERDGRSMIELAPGPAAVGPTAGPERGLTPMSSAGPMVLRGEIVDSKCFLGAMRPGDGKAHRACAQLCIAGGLPPMLVARDEAGVTGYFLLTTADGGAANSLVRPFIAERVEVIGDAWRLDDIHILRVAEGGIFRR